MQTEKLSDFLGIPNIDSRLTEIQKLIVQSIETNSPTLRMPLERITHSKGKFLRSILMLATVDLNKDIQSDKIIQACATIELLHISSLIHDDIIDQASTRRNIPTINSLEGVSYAVLAGDYLFASSISISSNISNKITKILATAYMDLCSGQAQELADSHNLNRTKENYYKTIENKTAALYATSCEIGGILQGYKSKECDALREFGRWFGMSFQLIDDVLDLYASKQETGKQQGNDIKEGVYTYPVILGLSSRAGSSLKSIIQSSQADQSSNEKILEILNNEDILDKTIHEVKYFNDKAKQALGPLNNNSKFKILADFPEKYFQWSLKAIK